MKNQKKTDYIRISKESEGPAPDTLDETLLKQEMKLIYKDDVPFYEDKGQLNTLILSGKDLIQELKLLDKYGISSISLNRYFCGNRINNLDF